MANPKQAADLQAAQVEAADKPSDEREVPATAGTNPAFDDLDGRTLEQLQALAKERGVTINPDVLKAHLLTELRAHASRGY